MRDELVELISRLSDTQKLKVARLLEVAAGSAAARSVIEECRRRGLDLERTLAELIRRQETP